MTTETNRDLRIVKARAEPEITAAADLFQEYARSLGIDLCFQQFDEELQSLPGRYAPPSGELLLARVEASYAGCVALRSLDDGICEMKRLYIRGECRGRGVGRKLAAEIIQIARDLGYQRMRLDTLASMEPAISLYRSLGFEETSPYYENPIPDARYFGLVL